MTRIGRAMVAATAAALLCASPSAARQPPLPPGMPEPPDMPETPGDDEGMPPIPGPGGDEGPPGFAPGMDRAQPAMSKEEIAELKSTYEGLSPAGQAEMKAYYKDLGTDLEAVLGISAVKAAEARRTQELLQHLGRLNFTRKPQAVLAARTKLALGQPEPNAPAAQGAVIAKWVHLLVMAGAWTELGAFLSSLDEARSQAVYSAVLQGMNRGDVGLLPEEVLAFAEACPGDPKPWQLVAWSNLLKASVGKHGPGPMLARIKEGTRLFGDADPGRRRRTVEFLAGAGLVVEAYKFLPPLEDARARGDTQEILVHALYNQNLGAHTVEGVQAEAYRNAAWELLCEVSLHPRALAETRRSAIEHAVGMMTRTPRAQVTPWLTRVFSSESLGPVALELIALNAVSINDSKLEVEERAQRIVTLKEAVEILLAHTPLEASALRVPLRMLTTALAAEIEAGLQKRGHERLRPGEMQLMLRAIPSRAWLDALESSLASRVGRASVGLAVKADEIDLALTLLSDAMKRSPESAADLADGFLVAWERRLNPASGSADEDAYFSSYFGYGFPYYYYDEEPPSGPVTRGHQRRNLERLHSVIAALASFGVEPQRLPSIAAVFRACHNATEVYDADDVVRVFGPLETIPASTARALAESMRRALNAYWRDRSAQQTAGAPKRTDAEIAQLVDKGFATALALIESAQKSEPDSWHGAVIRAALSYDRVQFNQAQGRSDPAKLTEYVRAAFNSFEQAALQYVGALARGEERESVQVYTRWFRAAVGASDLALLRAEDVPGEGSINDDQMDRIRGALGALPADAAYRHVSEFAREVGQGVREMAPEVKPRLVRSALRVIGDHPAGATLRSLEELYRDLVKDEIKLRLTVDGEDRVCLGRQFGVMLSLRFTNAVERETFGFSRYLLNNQRVYVGGQRREVNYRDQLQKSIETAFAKNFTIESIGFFDPYTPSRGVSEAGQDGWLEKPMAYILLSPKDASADHLPQVTMDMQFNDSTGPVTLVMPSNVPPLAVVSDPVRRPCQDLAVVQTVDAREVRARGADRAVKLEITAKGKGAIPDLPDLLGNIDTALAGFGPGEAGIEAKPTIILQEAEAGRQQTYGVGPARAPEAGYPEPDENGMYRLNVERSWVVTYRPTGATPGDQFRLPILREGVGAKLDSRSYADLDIAPISGPVLALSVPFWTPVRVGLGVATVAILGAAGFLIARRRRVPPPAPTFVGVPERITPLSATVTLRRMRSCYADRLNPSARESLDRQIVEIEREFFGPGGHADGDSGIDLPSVVRHWANVAEGAPDAPAIPAGRP